MRRLLVIRSGGIGDCILSLPVIEKLKQNYDETEIWVPFPAVPIMRANRVRSLEAVGIYTLKTTVNLVRSIRSFDYVVSWYVEDAFKQLCVNLNNIDFFDPLQKFDRIHMADFFLRQHGYFDTGIPSIKCPQAEPLYRVIIHPFSGSSTKNWNIQNYCDVADAINVPVRWVVAGWQSMRRPVERFSNLFELAHYMTSAQLYIGNDSGITHLAAALQVPTIALFGSTDPSIWGPRGFGKISVVRGRQNDVNEISVSEVISHVKEYFHATDRKQSTGKRNSVLIRTPDINGTVPSESNTGEAAS